MAAIAGLGALVTALAMLPAWWLEHIFGEIGSEVWPWVAPVLTGAALGCVAGVWLQSRASQVGPTEAQARLAELQARIRPHFLFNTLNTAIALVQIDPRRAEAVLEDLAELFREALAAPNASSTLRQEIALAKRYLDIESLRFGDRLQVDWSVDDSLGDTVLPVLVLQPLVENAVHHGVEPSPHGGWVRIQVKPSGGLVEVLITNSLPDRGLAPLHGQRGQGMALANVRERLRLMYDLESDLSVASAETPSSDGSVSSTYQARMVLPRVGGVWS